MVGRIAVLALAGCGSSAAYRHGDRAVASAGASEPVVVMVERATGAASDGRSVRATPPLTPVADDLYLTAITTKPVAAVDSVTGLGLAWFPVAVQCSGRGTTVTAVWAASGEPTEAGEVVVELLTPANVAVATVRYSGVDRVEPIGAVVGANTNGRDGKCDEGIDREDYVVQVHPTTSGSAVVAVTAHRNRSRHAALGFAEQASVDAGSGGDTAAITIQDGSSSGDPLAVRGTFSGAVDWAAVVIEVLPEGAALAGAD